jgi:hypothetical protein
LNLARCNSAGVDENDPANGMGASRSFKDNNVKELVITNPDLNPIENVWSEL